MSLGDKTLQAIKEIKQILEKHGKKGWLRVKECEKHFVRLNPHEKSHARHRRFYRVIKQIDKGKITDLQHIEVNGYAWIGLKEADPTFLKNQLSDIYTLKLKNELVKTWNKQIKEIMELASDDLYLNIAYNRTILFIKSLPEPIKKKMQPTFIKCIQKVNEKKDYHERKNAKFVAIAKLIDKASSLIYEYAFEKQ